VTGASGFIGRRLAPALQRAGYRVRVLLRRDPVMAEWRDLCPEIVAGSLEDDQALRALVDGATTIVHLAGAIKAARDAQFFVANHLGTTAVARAVAASSGQLRLLHLSTMAAREPRLSGYAASKRAGEDAAREILGDRVTVLRPPAVYGPGDREMLAFFRIAAARYVPLIGSRAARAAMIHVDDLVNLIVALVAAPAPGRVLTAADARPEGYTWEEVFATAARAVGNPDARQFRMPAAVLRAVAMAGDVARACGAMNMLNSPKLRELRHSDWSVPMADLARPTGWEPHHSLEAGFIDTVVWYRRAGWLR
jgi:nucleoside-diphosphate-sugar epimerase